MIIHHASSHDIVVTMSHSTHHHVHSVGHCRVRMHVVIIWRWHHSIVMVVVVVAVVPVSPPSWFVSFKRRCAPNSMLSLTGVGCVFLDLGIRHLLPDNGIKTPLGGSHASRVEQGLYALLYLGLFVLPQRLVPYFPGGRCGWIGLVSVYGGEERALHVYLGCQGGGRLSVPIGFVFGSVGVGVVGCRGIALGLGGWRRGMIPVGAVLTIHHSGSSIYNAWQDNTSEKLN